MALKNKKTEEEELPFPIPGTEEETVEEKTQQVSFDDIEFEAEVVDEEELQSETTVYLTISGKEQQYEPEWDQYGVNDLDVGAEMEGRPEITIFENEDKSYNAMRLRVMDDGEILNCYFNFPKKAWPYVKNINTGFDFYRGCFDFIFNVLKLRDERNVIKNGKKVNKFPSMNLEMLAKYVDQHENVGVRITKNDPESEYNDWVIFKLE